MRNIHLIVELDGPVVEVDYLIDRVSIAGESGVVNSGQPVGRRTLDLLVRTQIGSLGRRPAIARLHLHGRHHPRKRLPDVRWKWPRCRNAWARRQCFPCGRRNQALILFDANKPGESWKKRRSSGPIY